MEGHGAIWLECHVTGELTQCMHFTTSPAGGEGDQEGCFKSEVLQWALPKWLIRGKAQSWEDQEEVPGGVPARELRLRQSSTPDKIPEERIIRKGRPTHLTESGADSRLVHLDRRCWKAPVTGQKGQEVCQVTRRRIMRLDRMVRTPSDPTVPMRGVHALSAWVVGMLHQAEHRGGGT